MNPLLSLKEQGQSIWLDYIRRSFLTSGRFKRLIEDDGIGFDPLKATRQFGLLGIRERLHLLNGDLFVFSCPGQGTRLRVTVPLETHG